MDVEIGNDFDFQSSANKFETRNPSTNALDTSSLAGQCTCRGIM